MDKVGGPESKSVTTGKPMSSQLQHGKLIRAALIRLDYLVLRTKLSSRLDKVIWESSRRSSGSHVGHQLGRLGPLTSQQVFW
jgi:hypothetical protein